MKIAAIGLSCLLLHFGCRNPMSVHSVVDSPEKQWRAEIIVHDVGQITGTSNQREFIVIVRSPAEKRDTSAHMVLRALATDAPTLIWRTDRQLEIVVGRGTEIVTKSESHKQGLSFTIIESPRSGGA
jgi:hypothetical protein